MPKEKSAKKSRKTSQGDAPETPSTPYTKLTTSERREKKSKATPVVERTLNKVRTTTTLTTETGTSPFLRTDVQLKIHLPPCFVGKAVQGVNEQLNAFLMRYTPQVDGVVLSHTNLRFQQSAGRIMYDAPYSHFRVQTEFLVWRPTKGSRLVGTVTIQSPSHIGLLLQGTFNASISSEEIPKDVYEWRAGEVDGNTGSQGEWVVKETGAAVNSAALGCLQFVVLDLIKANDMLTVNGTLKNVPPPIADVTPLPQPSISKTEEAEAGKNKMDDVAEEDVAEEREVTIAKADVTPKKKKSKKEKKDR